MAAEGADIKRKGLSPWRFAARLFALPGSKILARSFCRWFARHRYHIAKAFLPDKREAKRQGVDGHLSLSLASG